MNIIYSDFKELNEEIYCEVYNTVNFQPVTFRILFFRGIANTTSAIRWSKSMFLLNTTTKAVLPGMPTNSSMQ